MTRGVEVHEAVQSTLPEWSALALGLATQLGDVWLLFSLVAVLYLAEPSIRDRIATLLALALLASVAVEALKHGLDLPRPAAALAAPERTARPVRGLLEATATADGPGFPSGHATLSTTVLLGLAGGLPGGNPRRRTLLAVVLIVAIAATRVALGVHFLVDVLAGMGLGLAVLAGGAAASRSSPVDPPSTIAASGVALGGIGVAIAAPSLDPGGLAAAPETSLLALAGAAGTLAGWQPVVVDGRGSVTARTVRLGVTTAIVAGHLAVVAIGAWTGALTVALAAFVGLAVALGVALPAVVPGFDDRIAPVIPLPIRIDLGAARAAERSPERRRSDESVADPAGGD